MFTQEGSAWKFNNPHVLWCVLIVTIHFILFLLNQNQNHSSITKKIMFGVDVYSFKWKRTELYVFWSIFFLIFEKLSLKLIISFHLYTMKICWIVLSRSVEHPFGILWTRFGCKSLFQLSYNRCSTEYIINCNIQCKTFDGKSFTLLLNRWKTIV